MTPESINLAMADLDGWKLSPSAGYKWTSPDGKRELRLPHDYTEDLNAVARVVTKLAPLQLYRYKQALKRMRGGYYFKAIDATAIQRCEAVLRACGKWVDG